MHYLILLLGGLVMNFIFAFVHRIGPKPSIAGQGRFNCWGDFGLGGGVKGESSTTTQDETKKNIYTPEQEEFLKSFLTGATGTSSSLINSINAQLQAANAGNPTPAEAAYTRQAKEGIAGYYKDLATQTSEALAGRGTLDSGIANKMMTNLQGEQAKANQAADVTSAQRQQEDLLNAIKSALGIASIGAGLSTQEQGYTDSIQKLYDMFGWNADASAKIKF